jgi:hypothetical protein
MGSASPTKLREVLLQKLKESEGSPNLMSLAAAAAGWGATERKLSMEIQRNVPGYYIPQANGQVTENQ